MKFHHSATIIGKDHILAYLLRNNLIFIVSKAKLAKKKTIIFFKQINDSKMHLCSSELPDFHNNVLYMFLISFLITQAVFEVITLYSIQSLATQ